MHIVACANKQQLINICERLNAQ